MKQNQINQDANTKDVNKIKTKKTTANKAKLLNSVIALMLPLVSYGLLGPLEMYAGSPTDFNFSLWIVLAGMGILSVVGLVLGTTILYVIPDQISAFLRKILLIFGIMSYIQYMFLNRQLARQDGNAMEWDAMKSTMVVNTAIWLIGISILTVVIIKLKDKWEKVGNYAALFLILIQAVAVVSLLITTPKGTNDNYHLSAENQYNLASKENIIILILDSYGNRQLEAACEENPQLLDDLKDFTYYNNCDSQYDRTYPTVTSMVTGIPFDFNSEDPLEYTTKAWTSARSDSFFDTLHNGGWGFEVYAVNSGCNYGDLECNGDKIDNAVYTKGDIRWKRLLVHFTKASIYKFGPYVLKPYFEELTGDYQDINVYEDSFDDHLPHLTRVLNEEGIGVEDVEKKITILHTFGAHDAKSTADIEEVHQYISLYLNNLKKAGKYEDSTIIITADHGMMWSFAGKDPQPIFFIKPPGESSDEVKISNAPISEADFQGTIIDLIGTDTMEFQPSIFDWEEGQERERTFYLYDSENTYAGYTYFSDREELLEKLEQGESVKESYNAKQ